ncbi:hypothetical protein LVB87_09785 [Lysobacter sp. KIS68-7]|uniref:hypothetical protein n=1 Tax=Lysobacter sp. KIS68-7 TaxID=2904252 RepID=UPI001E3E2D79|nr:hypothetical protein [Lysobacter sp. KIS68-7]UHQ18502.1 hypothetical protein LVB87_09785 [Lysobacter sp. KIS68-7]
MNTKAWTNAIAATGYAAIFFILMAATHWVTARATAGFGHAPHDGTDVRLVATAYFAPAMLFFATAAYAQRYRWRAREVLHGLAWGWALMPFALFAGVLSLAMVFG